MDLISNNKMKQAHNLRLFFRLDLIPRTQLILFVHFAHLSIFMMKPISGSVSVEIRV